MKSINNNNPKKKGHPKIIHSVINKIMKNGNKKHEILEEIMKIGGTYKYSPWIKLLASVLVIPSSC